MDITAQMEQWVLILNAVNKISDKPEHFKLKQDFSETLVEELLFQAAEHFCLDAAAIYFMCWGRILDSRNSLESYGIKNGTLMILRQKNLPKSLSENKDVFKMFDSKNELNRVTLDRAIIYRKELKYLNKHSFPFARSLKTDDVCREKFTNSFPELFEDPSLFGVFTEISTISALLDLKYLPSTLKRYPTFLDVTQHFIDLWRDEISKNPNANAELNNLFFLTDDEDETEGQQPGSSNANRSQQQTNRSDLSNLAGNISSIFPRLNRRGNSSRSNSSQITAEMLRSALQSSMSNSTSECLPLPLNNEGFNESSTPSSSNASSSSRTPMTLAEQLSRANSVPQTPSSSSQPGERSAQVQTLIDRLPQLQAMRELGITDEIVAIQALEAANGDLEAAVNIIFSEDN